MTMVFFPGKIYKILLTTCSQSHCSENGMISILMEPRDEAEVNENSDSSALSHDTCKQPVTHTRAHTHARTNNTLKTTFYGDKT